MNNKTVSVVVPAYNAEKTIKRCLDSIVEQTISNFKVYVVNDGSIDNTATILDNYKNDKRFNIIHILNSGVSVARNEALQLVDTDYITFIDSDDYVDKNYLQDLIGGFVDEDIDMVATDRKYLNEDLSPLVTLHCDLGIYSASDGINMLLDENGPQGYITGKIFKTNIIKESNMGLDPNIHVGEDLIFCIQYLLNAKKINIISSLQYNYIQYSNSLSHAATLYNRQKSFKEAYSNYLDMALKLKTIVPNKPKYYICQRNINARIARICEDFLRTMYLNKKIVPIDKNLEKRLTKMMNKYKKDFYKSKLIGKKQKAYFWLLLNFPLFIHVSDKKRFK